MISDFQEYWTPTNNEYACSSLFQTDSPQSPTMTENGGSIELWGAKSENYMCNDSTSSILKRERSIEESTPFTAIPLKISSLTHHLRLC